jgi:hypothetical protein
MHKKILQRHEAEKKNRAARKNLSRIYQERDK